LEAKKSPAITANMGAILMINLIMELPPVLVSDHLGSKKPGFSLGQCPLPPETLLRQHELACKGAKKSRFLGNSLIGYLSGNIIINEYYSSINF
jgi:hypothetical protein